MTKDVRSTWFWKALPKSKQPGRGVKEANKSYETLIFNMSDPLIHVKLCFFEESVKKLNDFLVAFQTTAPLVPFLVNSLEIPVRRFAEKFILPDVLSKIKNQNIY